MTQVTLLPLESVPPSELEALSEQVFANEEPSQLLAQVVATEASSRLSAADDTPPGSFGLAAYRGAKLIGWTQGYRLGSNQFHMLNSGVTAEERRNGVYSQLVLAVLEHARTHGYVSVRSLHVAANSPVIIAKLRLGFYIAGFEYSEVYGPLVQLRYLIGEHRRALYNARTASIRPARNDA